MTRSSRYKSHKQHKHTSKDAREHSESEEDVNLKERKGREDGSVRVPRDSGSSEKRKLVSQAVDGKGLLNPGNGDFAEEFSASKRRKERSDGTGTDRWNGGSSVGDKELKELKGDSSRVDSEKALKSKILVDSKSKSSRRHESSSERKEVNVVPVVENEEGKRSSTSSKPESKSKSEKDLARKEVHHYKEVKDKEHGVDRERKSQDVRRERSVDRVSGRGIVSSVESRKPGSHSGAVEDRPIKREVGNTDWQMHDELRNPELEKELDKRIRRRRDDSDDKDKYQDDVRDANEKKLSADRSKNGRHKDEKNKDEKSKDDGYRDKYREDLDRDRRTRDEKRRDERSSKERTSERSESRHTRDDIKSIDRQKKSKAQNSDRDGSSRFDDRDRYKDNRGKKRSSDDEDHNDLKRSSKEHRYEMEKKMSSGKGELLADRGRSQSRLADADSTVSSSRRKSSPSSSAHFARDQYRHSTKHAESKYKDPASEERVRTNISSSRDIISVPGAPERISELRSSEKPRSVAKPVHKDENQLAELPVDRSPISDAEVSPIPLKEKSHSSASIDRRHSNRMSVRRSLDVEETGRRSFGSKDARDYSANEDRRSHEWPLEKPAADEFSQVDGDTVSVSSSFTRNNNLPCGSSSLLPPPPPFRTGVDSPSVFGTIDEDSRGKSSNRYKRSGDPNVGRGQGNAWKSVPNWSTPVTNGFVSFQHGPPPGGFHAMMPQFPTPPMFSVRPSMELNPTGVPYHIPDADRFSGHVRPFGWRNPADEACPPHLHGWDGSNGVFRDESHMHGRLEWEQNRPLITDRGWEGSLEMWKSQSSSINMEFPSASRKDDNLLHAPNDEAWSGKPGQRSRNDRGRPNSRAESIEIERSDDIPPPQEPIEAPALSNREKTPDHSKISDDIGAHSCNVYLSRLDISENLTHPELFKKCTSVLDDGVNNQHVYPEESGKAAVKIPTSTLKASLFPMIKDSVFQRAMALYKKQADERKVQFSVSSFPGSVPNITAIGENMDPVPTITGEKREPVQTPIGQQNLEPARVPVGEVKMEADLTSTAEKSEEWAPASYQEKVEGLVSLSNHEKAAEQAEPVPSSEQEIVESVLNSCGVEDPVLTPGDGMVEEPVLTPGDTIVEEPVRPCNVLEKVDAVTSSDLENLKELKNHSSPQHASECTADAPSNMDTDMAVDGKGDSFANNSALEMAFRDTVCAIGITDGSSEACEAIMPESIECRSLSRIHHSPESTH